MWRNATQAQSHVTKASVCDIMKMYFMEEDTTGLLQEIWNLGGINKLVGGGPGGCKHARRANLHWKTEKKQKKITLSQRGVVSQLGGYLLPL